LTRVESFIHTRAEQIWDSLHEDEIVILSRLGDIRFALRTWEVFPKEFASYLFFSRLLRKKRCSRNRSLRVMQALEGAMSRLRNAEGIARLLREFVMSAVGRRRLSLPASPRTRDEIMMPSFLLSVRSEGPDAIIGCRTSAIAQSPHPQTPGKVQMTKTQLSFCRSLAVICFALWANAASAQTLTWSKPEKYNKGVETALAAHLSGLVLDVHQTHVVGTSLWYHVGTLSGTGVTWGGSQRVPWDGNWPNVTITNDGLVLLVYSSGRYKNGSDLFYAVGKINPYGGITQSIT
jgi:hypothetical protein